MSNPHIVSYPGTQANNWLAAVTINSFMRLSAGKPMSDLNQLIVSTSQSNGFTEEILSEIGHSCLQRPEQYWRSILPGRFAELNASTSYTLADLKVDLSPLTESPELILSPPPSSNAANALGGLYSIRATKFKCKHENHRWNWGDDEVYWIFSVIALNGNVEPKTSRTHIFRDVDRGETKSFEESEGWIWGGLGHPLAMPKWNEGGHLNTGVLAVLTAWEHDAEDPDKVAKAVRTACAITASVLGSCGGEYGAIAGTILGGITPLINILIKKAAKDDFIDSVEWFIDRSYISDFTESPQTKVEEFSFTGDHHAHHKLTIEVKRSS